MATVRQIQRTYYLILSLFWLATGLPLALSVLLAQSRHLDLFELGLIMAAYSLAIVVFEVPTGGLADAIGRKRVAVLAYLFGLSSSVLFLFSFSFPMLLSSFVLMGIGRALSSGALDAWFVDSLRALEPEIDLQPSLGRAGTFTLLALGIGTLVGSALPQLAPNLPAEGTAVLTPLSIPLLAAIVIQVITVVLTILLVQEKRPAGTPGGLKEGMRQVPAMVRTGFELTRQDPIVLRLLAVSFAGGLVLVSLEVLWQPHFALLLGGREANTIVFGLIMGGNFVAGMVGNMLAEPLGRLLGKRYGLVCAIFQGLRGLSLIGLAWVSAPVPAVLLFWLGYLNMGIVNSPHATLMNNQLPAQQRSSMLSIESLVAYLGSILGSVGLGYLAQQTSIGVAWALGGAILVVSLSLYLSIDARRPKAGSEAVGTLSLAD